MKRILFSVALAATLATMALAQRPNLNKEPAAPKPVPVATPGPAPTTFKAKYEGGMFGYPKPIEGTLSFDDVNNRLVFRNDKQKEILWIPYASVTGAFADTHKVRPAAATAGSMIPDVGLGIGLIKTKQHYLAVQFNDPDSNVAGATSFRVDQELLDSVLNALATKASLTARGDIFVKKRP